MQNWVALKGSGYEMYWGFRYRTSLYEGNDEAHSRVMSVYQEVADWRFMGLLLFSLLLGIIMQSRCGLWTRRFEYCLGFWY